MGTKVGNFLRWLVGLFKSLTAKAKKLAPEIIQVVENVKNFVDSPRADFLTSVIPGTLDDTVQKLLKLYLPKLLLILNTTESYLEIEDPNEQSKAIVASFQVGDQDTKDMFFHSLASKLVQGVTEEPWSKSIFIAEGVYQRPEVLNA